MGSPVVHFEINGPDGTALSRFYGELFRWKTQEIPDSGYTTIDTNAGTGINGGVGTTRGDMRAGAIFYVEVPDLQATLDKAGSLGGSTAMPVTDMGMVTFARVADPEGNQVGIVTPGEGPGVSKGDGCEVAWWEVLGTNPGALLDFYTKLFDWTVSRSTTENIEYHQMETGSGERGIAGGIGGSPDGAAHVNVYAGVDDLQKYCEVAESLGAKVTMQPTQVAENTKIALFLDPQGNAFGMYEGM